MHWQICNLLKLPGNILMFHNTHLVEDCFMKRGFNTMSPFGDTDRVSMNPLMGRPFLDKSAAPTETQVSYLAVKNLNEE